jgi:hypothetical protein
VWLFARMERPDRRGGLARRVLAESRHLRLPFSVTAVDVVHVLSNRWRRLFCSICGVFAWSDGVGHRSMLFHSGLGCNIHIWRLSRCQVTYRAVTEDTNTEDHHVPLFGPPYFVGNAMKFNPVGFESVAMWKSSSDITSGQLDFMVEANDKQIDTISNLHISQEGHLVLAGAGTDATSVAVRMQVAIEIVEVDGAAIAPIELSEMTVPPLPVPTPAFRLFNPDMLRESQGNA